MSLRSTSPPALLGLDHVVVNVSDCNVSAKFYADVLGMNTRLDSHHRCSATFADQKLNLHSPKTEVDIRASRPTIGGADLCLRVHSVAPWLEHFHRLGIGIEHGPIERTGAVGSLYSIYVRDPDGNLIELAEPLAPPLTDALP